MQKYNAVMGVVPGTHAGKRIYTLVPGERSQEQCDRLHALLKDAELSTHVLTSHVPDAGLYIILTLDPEMTELEEHLAIKAFADCLMGAGILTPVTQAPISAGVLCQELQTSLH